MKKNIAIAVLSLLCIGFFFYGLIQKIEKRALELAQEQAAIATLRAIEAGKNNK